MARSGQIRNTASRDDQQAPPGEMGAVPRQEVMPSGDYQQFNQSGIRVEYPSNWQVMGLQQGGDITIAPQAGAVQGAIAYGVIISGFNPRNSSSPNDAMNELVGSLQQSNPNLRPVGSAQSIRVNNVPGRSLDLLGTSPIQSASGQPLQERDWLVALPSGKRGGLVYLIFVSPDRDSQRLRPTFEYMLKSFQLQQ